MKKKLEKLEVETGFILVNIWVGKKIPSARTINIWVVPQVSECNETPLVHSGRRSVLLLLEPARMGEDEVLPEYLLILIYRLYDKAKRIAIGKVPEDVTAAEEHAFVV